MNPMPHADVVGSLLRPPELLQARTDLAAGAITSVQLKAAEDRAVDAAVRLQEAAGLEVVTDGEMRRLSFQAQMTAAVEGFGEHGLDAFLWGEWHGGAEAGGKQVARPPGLGVRKKLRRKRFLSADEFSYLQSRTSRLPKVTLPAASLWANFWSEAHSRSAYSTLDGFLADVADILRGEVAELIRRGARYIQLDAPHYTALLHPATRAFYERDGWSLDKWLGRGIELDNAVMGDFEGVTFGFHL